MQKTGLFTILFLMLISTRLYSAGLIEEARYFPEKNDFCFYTDFTSIMNFMKSHGISADDSMLIFGDKAANTVDPVFTSFKIGFDDIQEILVSGQTEEIEKNAGILTLIRIKPNKGEIPASMRPTGIKHENTTLYKIDASKDFYIAKVDSMLVAGLKPILTSYITRRNAKQVSNTPAINTFTYNSKNKTVYFLVTVTKFLKDKMDSSLQKGSAYGKGLNENVFIKSLLLLNSVEGGLTLGSQVDLFAGMQSATPADGGRLVMVSHFMIVGASFAVSFMDAWSKSMSGKGIKPKTSEEDMAKIQAMFGRIRTNRISNGVMLSFTMNQDETSAFVKKLESSINTAKTERKARIEKEKITGLNDAIRLGDIEKVKKHAGEGVEINGIDRGGDTPLAAASSIGRIDIVTFLIERGADVKGKSDKGITALHKAAGGGHMDIVRLLIGKGADVFAEDDSGERAYDKARNNSRKDVAEFFEKTYKMGQGIDNEGNKGTTDEK